MIETFLSYLSYAVAFQGAFTVGVVAYTLVEHFAGKRGESFGTSRDEEKLYLVFFGVWFLLTLGGFYYDAVSTPQFKYAFSLDDRGLGVLLGYISVFGSLICLLYAPYRIGWSSLYLFRNRGRHEPAITLHDDPFFGEMICLDTSLYSMLTGSLILGGENADIEVTYPAQAEIPEGLHDRVRDDALAKAKELSDQIEVRYNEYRTDVAKYLHESEFSNGKSIDDIAANVRLSRIECMFEFTEQQEQLGSDLILAFSNDNGFGDDEIFAGIDEHGNIDLSDQIDEEDEITGSSDSAEPDDAANTSESPEILEDESRESIKQSYL